MGEPVIVLALIIADSSTVSFLDGLLSMIVSTNFECSKKWPGGILIAPVCPFRSVQHANSCCSHMFRFKFFPIQKSIQSSFALTLASQRELPACQSGMDVMHACFC